MAFATPVVEHWLEREIAQWVLKLHLASFNERILIYTFLSTEQSSTLTR